MGKTVIPLNDLRAPLAIPAARGPSDGALGDRSGRKLRDLRISVTDRCNFRCVYCMPKEVFDADYPFLPQPEVLSFEEIVRLARLFRDAAGIEKIRLTGGEPLLRRDIESLVAQLRATLDTSIDGIITIDEHGKILAVNAAAKPLFSVLRMILSGNVSKRSSRVCKERSVELLSTTIRLLSLTSSCLTLANDSMHSASWCPAASRRPS